LQLYGSLNRGNEMRSVVSGVALGDIVGVIQPVDFVDQLMGLDSEADGLDMEVFESLVGRVAEELLVLNSHELRVEPRAE